jgi:uncharacterized membrane protein
VMRITARKWPLPLLSALGFADAAYLAITHWRGELPPCGGYAGCDVVNTSRYAEIYGVPIAAFGALLFALLLVAALVRGQPLTRNWLYGTLALYCLSLAAAVFMAYLTAIEFFVLHAVCYWCLAMAVITFLVLALITREVWAFEP